ncbi:MAG: LuxR C-terminal-related transcriptional regulator, partial [Zavarzinia sp.]|nr:LuxR C-terminal-related transcriptional regulator [Zavarzinia sp.]
RLGHASSAASTTSLMLAQACYELGELDNAARYLKFGLPHITDHGVVEAAVAGFRVMIRGKARQEGFEAALDACYECEGVRRDYGPRLALMLLNEYVWLTLRHGRVDKAVEATGFDGSTFRNACLAVREGQWEVYDLVSALIRTRILIATNNADVALRIIAGALAVAARSGRRAIKVELLVLRSRAEVAAGRQQRAHRTLLEALSEAMPLGMVQMFVDEGPALQSTLNAVMPMLMQLPDIDAAFVDTVQPVPPPASDACGEDDGIAAGEVFSRREIQILKLLDSGLTNEAVAERLFLSLKTVKWYLYTIYPKLGAKNRTGALAKARKLGLL